MAKQQYGVREYQIALEAMDKRGMAPSARAMLEAHYAMPNHVATMRHIAASIGYPHDHRQGNLRYGTLAGRLRRELGMPQPSMELWAIATWDEDAIDDLNEFSFRMRPELATALERIGWVSSSSVAPSTGVRKRPDIEGEVHERLQMHRKRERWLRDAKIDGELSRSPDRRLRCQVPRCGFDFVERYGDLGEHYIQVHHLKSIASREKPEQTKLKDLILICANCHVIIHRDGENRDPNTLLPLD